MTKAGLVRVLYERHGALTKSEASQVVDRILRIMKDRVLQGERILITNFGSFEVLARRTRRGRNPATGEIISIRPRRTIVFRSARKLERALNGEWPEGGHAGWSGGEP